MSGIDLMDVIRVGEGTAKATAKATKTQTANCESAEDMAA
jgi:hypothetical protein